eukprot:COSAG01_NODE_5244_length_4388_cov_6.643740_4_plen_122_part_00
MICTRTRRLQQNAAYAVNVPHNYLEQGRTVGAMVQHALAGGFTRVEVTAEAEAAWVDLILQSEERRMLSDCTPGYYNGEGQAAKLDPAVRRRGLGYPKGPLAYFKYLQAWRQGDFSGIAFS